MCVCVCERERQTETQTERKEVRTKLLKSSWTKAMKFADHDWERGISVVRFVPFSLACRLQTPSRAPSSFLSTIFPLPISSLSPTTVAINARTLYTLQSLISTSAKALYVAVGDVVNVFRKHYILIFELEPRGKETVFRAQIRMSLKKT